MHGTCNGGEKGPEFCGREETLKFDGVKVFSATKVRDRLALGELVSEWLRKHPEYQIVDKIVTQSSDREFHCITITLFYVEEP